ncbi:MAG: hypothetical protein CENE_01920 [Candidatus Celerinatantimonas neptuna]|nr:MAG: hypothetical protein CENE_01920 [Candidatus Celerinatantimonas neptuna]
MSNIPRKCGGKPYLSETHDLEYVASGITPDLRANETETLHDKPRIFGASIAGWIYINGQIMHTHADTLDSCVTKLGGF